jgi:phospholipid-binding lipoprotein MlaA
MTDMLRLLRRLRLLTLCAVAGIMLTTGCATTGSGDPRDPLEPMNRAIYTFNDGLDTVLIKPLAIVYEGVVPEFIRTGISNMFSNINDILVALNNLLQGKVTAAGLDVSRVIVNSSVGLLGFFDVASKIGLEKNDEDFGQTLGVWGVGDGPYLVLPFLGPRTLRDAVGTGIYVAVDPVSQIDPSRDRNQVFALRLISDRTKLLGASNVLETAALDPYEFVRDAYLQRRRNQIYDGNPPREKFDDANAAEVAARGVNRREPEPQPVALATHQPTPAEEQALPQPGASAAAVETATFIPQ